MATKLISYTEEVIQKLIEKRAKEIFESHKIEFEKRLISQAFQAEIFSLAKELAEKKLFELRHV